MKYLLAVLLALSTGTAIADEYALEISTEPPPKRTQARVIVTRSNGTKGDRGIIVEDEIVRIKNRKAMRAKLREEFDRLDAEDDKQIAVYEAALTQK